MIIGSSPEAYPVLLTVFEDTLTHVLTACGPRQLTGWQLYLVMRAVQAELRRVDQHTSLAVVD